MESFCGTHHHPNPYHLSLARPTISKPLFPFSLKPPPYKPFSSKTLISLRASHETPKPLSSSSNNPKSKTLETLSSLLKPTCIALTAAAALFLSLHLPKPSHTAVATSLPNAAATVESKESETITEDEKERILEEYLDSHPDDVKSLRTLMEIKIRSRKLPEAIDIVDRLILIEPGEKELPLLKAHLRSYSGDTETAKLGFEEVLSTNPLLVEAYHGLVMMASQSESGGELDGILKRVESAMEMCKKQKRKEELRDFKLLVAQVRVIEGKHEEALTIYQELVKEEPRDFRPYLCQGIIYTLLRKKDEAEKQFQKYQRLVPKGHPYAQYLEDNMTKLKVFS